ncbi:restriction endonuclease subunit S [Erysipelothrix rhusiopathiae]|nr:restriction endonuclease subunit S [Erysipelothrix rhusiopathiae]MDE8173685.1 restriction endonuclease subunit S [Erysipelothrix rhusiopathiae]MDE8182348.1 restriction endonuclease subunit S [Erysipelothrix rhusiopathiae]MDE9423487.1 restriction endonuclease subunit S [Erysipelothrix rhusiopathiae]
MKNKPDIRFDGFNDSWELRELGDLLKYEQPTKYIVNTTDYNDGFETPVLTAGQSFILGYTDETDGIKSASNSDPVIIFDDFTTSSHYVDFPFKVKSSAMKLLSLKSDKEDFYFVYNTLKNINYTPQSHERHWISKFSEFGAYVPSTAEQGKIGSFFQSLDHLITLHQRELENYKLLKKGFLQKLFPSNGDTNPSIRFDGFTDAWEQRRLGELGSVAMNKRIFKEETSEDGDIPFFKIGTFGGNPDSYISRKKFEEYKSKYSYPEIGDLLLSVSGSIGRIVEYKGEEAYYQDSNIVWLKHDKRLINSFLKQFYSVVKWSGLEGSTIKRLYNKNILETEIKLPTIEEQYQIGTFFQSLDNLITLHQRELDNYKELKKGFLQKMFV